MRRSSRIKGESPSEHSPSKLSALVEREDTPDISIQNDSAASTNPTSGISLLKTPVNTGTPRPNAREMHPGRFHSTTKKAASELRFGLPMSNSTAQTPPKFQAIPNSVPQSAPKPITTSVFSSPSFDFRFKRPSNELSPEAKRMMDDLREQAARIKGELSEKNYEGGRNDNGPALATPSGRKIATPRGQSRRFSELHRQQFQKHFSKMDSIQNHASAFRADPSRTPPKTSLKRTGSKAGLDRPDREMPKATKSQHMSIESSGEQASPAKRLKQQHNMSNSRPVSRDDNAKVLTPNCSRPQSHLPVSSSSSALATPKTILPRPQSSHGIPATSSKIPSLTRSPSTKSLTGSPQKQQVPQTDATNKYRKGFAAKLNGVKSILRRPQLRFSNDPVKIASGTHVSMPSMTEGEAVGPMSPSNGLLPSVPQQEPGTPSHRKEKHVNFSPSPPRVMGSPNPGSPATPSPTKKPAAVVTYPSLPTLPGESKVAQSPGTATQAAFATMAKARASIPGGPGDFTFQSDRAISFAPSSSKATSPRADPATPTIRRVRGSDAHGLTAASATKIAALPHVPHGLSNKKRKREGPEENEQQHVQGHDFENKENQGDSGLESSPAKKRRVTTQGPLESSPNKGPASSPSKPAVPSSNGRRNLKRHTGAQQAKTRAKTVLSLSRLSELAKPKGRH